MQRAVSPIWMVLAAIISVQIGAALAKTQFETVTPTAMAWLRLVAAAVMLLLLRPTFRGLTRRDWVVGLGLAMCLATMNWSIYLAFSHIPLGLAITIEFLGPLTVALIGSRRWADLIWVALAGAGVAMLGAGPAELNVPGIAFSLLAAAGWAGYIVLGAKLSPQWKGASVLLLSAVIGSVLLTGPALSSSASTLLQPQVLLVGVMVGVLSSVVPYQLELRALKAIETRIFGILQALGPVAAALAGLVILNEQLGPTEWLAIVCVVAASVGVTWRRRTPATPPE